MQKVIHISEIQKYSEYIDQSVIDYIGDGQIETYESFDTFSLIAFDWYDLVDADRGPAQIMLYLDQDDLFYICENEDVQKVAQKMFTPGETNEQAMYFFFRNLFRGSQRHLEEIEMQVSEVDDAVTEGTNDSLRDQIVELRREIFRMKKYYEQMEFLFDEICDNDNALISVDYLKYFEILRNRSIRLSSQTMHLREYIAQVRESYQAQIGIEQNDLMKVFTLITSIFLPLTLIAGWYGMNVQMPEFGWRYGYLFVVGICVLALVLWMVFIRRKKWF